MTNPVTPAGAPVPPAGGGMPKWLIILLVIGLVVVLGCCGGFAACHWMCTKVVTAGAEAAQNGAVALQQRAMQAQADAQAAMEQQRAAAVAAGGNGQAMPDQAAPGAPAAGGTGGAAAAAGGNNQGIADSLGTGRMPANFPTDVPVLKGLTPSGISTADKVKGSGMIMMTGPVAHDDAVAYYDKELQNQGWKEETNQDIMGQTIMTFSKDTRTLTVQVVPDGNTGKSMVNLVYETKP